MSANIQPPQAAHFPSLAQQRQPAHLSPYPRHPKDPSISGATVRYDFKVEQITTTTTTTYMRTPVAMAVFLALISAAVFIILVLAIRMTYLDDKRARRPPSALPAGERMVRWEDDVVYVERGGGGGLREKLWEGASLFRLGRKKDSGSVSGVVLCEVVIGAEETVSKGQQ